MNRRTIVSIAVGLLAGNVGLLFADAETPWPAPVLGFKAPQAREHPRLFFRRSDLVEIKKRAETPEGQAIVKQLRVLLDGKEGKTLPEVILTAGDKAPAQSQLKPGMVLGMFHPAGYGMLYHLTGDKLYAELGQQAMERIITDARELDPRYGFVAPNGALRAGPSLGAVAMGYDLCYDGWDESFRQMVAQAIQRGPNGFSLAALVQGKAHGPDSNHWGCQIGGGALALLAIWKDGGVDNAKIENLLEDSKKAIVRQVTEGFGDGGFFWESKGPSGIGSDTAYIPAVQAWRVAGGLDFATPRPNIPAIPLLKVQELLTIKGEPWYLVPPKNGSTSGYGSGFFGQRATANVPNPDRGGLSRGGQFAQGFGVVPDKIKPAMLWVYNHIVEPDPGRRTYDTLPYNGYQGFPHRAVLALVNWPIGMKEVNPAEIMPKVAWDNRLGLYTFRNQWTGTDDDIVVNTAHRARDPNTFMAWGKGQRLNLGPCPKGDTTHFLPAEDGSGTLTVGPMALGVDFSKASGADGLIVVAGMNMTPSWYKWDSKSENVCQMVSVGAHTLTIVTLGGKPAEPVVGGGTVTMGLQEIRYDGKKIVFAKMAGPLKLPRLGLWNDPPRTWTGTGSAKDAKVAATPTEIE